MELNEQASDCITCWFNVNQKCCHAIAMSSDHHFCHYFAIREKGRPTTSAQLKVIPASFKVGILKSII
jgi:hypothetical protein